MPSPSELMDALLASMETLEDATANVKTMFYGESGVGKTVLAMQLAQRVTPENKEILFVDAAEGWVSLLNHPELTKRTKRMSFKRLDQLDLLLQAIEAPNTPFSNIGCIVADEISTIAKNDLDYVLAVRAARDPSKDKDVATQPDMGAATERMRRTFGNMLSMRINVILVSHIREDKDERTGRMIIRPGMMPKLSTTIREKLHDVAHMIAEDKTQEDGTPDYVRRLQVLPTRSVVAKTRVKGLNVHCTPEEYMSAVVEWMKGDRPSLEEREITLQDDLEVEVSNSESDEPFVGVELD